jgi:hypothetical protein
MTVDVWTVNENEDIYSGIVQRNAVRIRFFLEELYGLSCYACDNRDVFCMKRL